MSQSRRGTRQAILTIAPGIASGAPRIRGLDLPPMPDTTAAHRRKSFGAFQHRGFLFYWLS
ncbi:MAG TPA: hypothetical protein VGN75_11585, partial [Kaistia sp.]|nr:hypothetical protein [Kaistia sp.]